MSFLVELVLGTNFKTQSDILNVVVDVMKQYPMRRLTSRDYPVLLRDRVEKRWSCQQPSSALVVGHVRENSELWLYNDCQAGIL